MNRKTFLMSLPLMGFAGKLLKKNEDVETRDFGTIHGVTTDNTATNGKFVVANRIIGDDEVGSTWARGVRFVGNIPDGSLCYYNYHKHAASVLKQNVLKEKPNPYNAIGVRYGDDVLLRGHTTVKIAKTV